MMEQNFYLPNKGRRRLPFNYPGTWRQLVFCFIAIHFIALSAFMCARVAALSTPTYDMGLFVQMFHYMRRVGLALTTLERDMLLSHFNVHMSPIYYLFLPFFWLWPTAYCLQILQTATVLLALVPLSKLLQNELKLSANWRYTIYLLYVYAPAITGSNFYDLHENCFLPVCLFSLILANWQGNKLKVALFTCLTLAIKEDAMLYVCCLGVYFACKCIASYYQQAKEGAKTWYERSQTSVRLYFKQDKFYFVWQVIVPLVYFALVVYYLNHVGRGAMVNRFDNLLLPGQKGLIAIAFNFILHPVFILKQIFTPDKLRYLLTILLALGGIPLWQKHWFNYLLFGPLVVMNLLSNYSFQHSLIFQYNYGSSALLIYLTALSLANWQTKITNSSNKKRFLKTFTNSLIAVAVCCALIFTSGLLREISYSWRSYHEKRDYYQSLHAKLAAIPRNKVVIADTFLTTDLADISELYDLGYHCDKKADRKIDLVVAFRNGKQTKEIVNQYRRLGYIENKSLSSKDLVVLQKNV